MLFWTEPLHDLKGHLANLVDELPHLLSEDGIVSGSDARVALLEVNSLLRCKETVSDDIKLLTAVKMSERLYSSDDERTPKNILQLYKEVTYGKSLVYTYIL